MSTQRQFRKLIVETFNLQEIKIICFDLSIPYDEIPGDNLSSKINSFLVSVYKLERLEDLHTILVEERPKAQWPSLADLKAFEWTTMSQSVDLAPSVIERINRIGNVSGSNNTIVQGDGNTVVDDRGVNIGGNIDGGATIITGDGSNYVKEQTNIETQTNINEVKGDYIGGDKIGGDKYDIDGDMTITR